MSVAYNTVVQSHLVTNSTATVTLAQFDLTALPGVGQSLTPPYVVLANLKIFMTANPTPDHSSRVWQQSIAWERTGSGTGAAFRILGGPAADNSFNAVGLFGASTTNDPFYDISGNFGRCRVVPYSSSSLTWFTRMELTVLQG